MKKELRIGLVLLSIYLILNRYLNTPDLILGFLMGLVLVFFTFGFLLKNTYLKIENFKSTTNKSI